MPEPLDRAVGFLHRLQERCYTSKTPTPWGPAYFNDRFPAKYDLNYVWVNKEGDPAAIKASVDEVQGAADLAHRKIQIDDAVVGAALAPAFKDFGWMVEKLVVMAQEPKSAGPASAVEVRELSFADLRPSRMRWQLDEARHAGDVATQLVDSGTVTAQAVSARYLAGLIDGQVAGWCELYTEDGTAQVENVCTFTEFRGRGVARAVIDRSLNEARAAHCDFSFLIADDDDWPKELYERLGFKKAGYLYDFTQPAD